MSVLRVKEVVIGILVSHFSHYQRFMCFCEWARRIGRKREGCTDIRIRRFGQYFLDCELGGGGEGDQFDAVCKCFGGSYGVGGSGRYLVSADVNSLREMHEMK